MRSQRMSSELDDAWRPVVTVFYSRKLWRNSDPLWFPGRLCLESPPLLLEEDDSCVLPPVRARCRQINLPWNSPIIDSNVITQISASTRLGLLFFLNLEPPSESLTFVLIRGICRRGSRGRRWSLCSVDMTRWAADLKTNNKLFWTICLYLSLSSGFD